MFFPDYHLHSHFSTDSDADINDIISQAKSNGMNSICMTDHHDLDFPFFDENGERQFQLDLPSYYKDLSSLKEQLAPDFDLRIGVELGVMPSCTDKATEFAVSHKELDFIICSTHIVDGLDPYEPEYFDKYSDAEGYRLYFEAILDTVKGYTDFDVYGHLDYIVRYGKRKFDSFEFKNYRDIFEELLKIIIHNGRGIEVNTGGLYRGMSVAHPHIDILRLYKELGGEVITVGSDAHTADRVGYGFDTAKELLLSCGFKHYCTYEKRKTSFHDIH